jgi:putative endonuclease
MVARPCGFDSLPRHHLADSVVNHMDYYVYIVKCADGAYYTGMTRDVRRRVHSHNRGIFGSAYLSNKLPVELVYFELVGGSLLARRREKQIKHLTRDQKIQLIKSPSTGLPRFEESGARSSAAEHCIRIAGVGGASPPGSTNIKPSGSFCPVLIQLR